MQLVSPRDVQLLVLLLAQCFPIATAGLLLNSENISALSYQNLHNLIVMDQIETHRPAFKSLQTRQARSLDGLTHFCLDDSKVGLIEGWYDFELRQRCQPENYYRLPIPSAFNDITSNRTVRNYIGWFWYQFEIPLEAKAEKFHGSFSLREWWIQFESLNYLGLVWAKPLGFSSGARDPNDDEPLARLKYENNQSQARLLGGHVGGHLPFTFNLTDLVEGLYELSQRQPHSSPRIRITVAGSNLLTDDTIPSGRLQDLSKIAGQKAFTFTPSFDFFHFAGLLGSVHLIELPEVHWTLIEEQHHAEGGVTGQQQLEFEICYVRNWNSPRTFDLPKIDVRLFGLSRSPIEWVRGQVEGQWRKNKLAGENANCTLVFFEQQTWIDLANELDDGFQRPGELDAVNGHQNFRIVQFNLISESTPKTISVDTYELKLFNNQVKRWLFPDSRGKSCLGRPRNQLQGFGMHQEQSFSGRTMSLPAIMKDLHLVKALGGNVIRTSHYPYSNEYLSACDELGLLVIGETAAVGLSTFGEEKLKLHKQMLLEMMQRDHDHPSILMWSLANEPNSAKQEADYYFQNLANYANLELARYTREAGRPLTAAIAQSYKDDKAAKWLDVIMVNYYFAWYQQTEVLEAIRKPLLDGISGWSDKLGGKPIIISEFGADTVSGFHSLTGEIFSEEFQRDLLLEYESVFDDLWAANKVNSASNSTTCSRSTPIDFWGSMIWNFADFSTHTRLTRFGGNRKGLVDRLRRPKMAFETIRQVYSQRLR